MSDHLGDHHVDTAAIQQTLRETATRKPPLWQRPLASAAVIGICLTVMALVSNVALYTWGADKSEQLDDLKEQASVTASQQECRSAIAADDAVAQGNKALTAQRVIELAAANVLARDESLPEAERAVWREAGRKLRDLFIEDIKASQQRYEQALRRSRVNELCANGEVPEPQVQPLPVDPIVQLPPS